MMHCRALIILLAVVALANGQADGSHRRGGLGTSNYESVSAEPLTFEVAEPEPIDRERLLAEAEIEGADWMDAFDDMEDYEDMGLEDMEEFVDYDGDGFYDLVDPELTSGDFFEEDEDEEDIMVAYEEPEDEIYADSTYTAENDTDFFSQDAEKEAEEDEESLEHLVDIGEDEDSEGWDDIGEPLQIYTAPVTRKLRRVVQKEEAIISEDEERRLAEKMSFRDDSIPDYEPTLDENGEFQLEVEPGYEAENLLVDDQHRNLQTTCRSNQRKVKIQMVTDNSGWENRWEIRRGNGALVSKGPPGNTKYASNKQFIGTMCLNAGTYRFIVYDQFKDGMCGQRTGKGLYRFYVNGAKKFTSPANCALNWAKRVHQFTIKTSAPAPAPNPQPQPQAIASRGGCSNVKVQFKVDKHGSETTVTLAGNGSTQLESRRNVAAYQTKTMQKCLPPGTYTLRLQDQDGICCNNGKGFYRMFVNGVKVISGGYFIGSKSHTIKIGTNWQAQMSNRAREWLNAHNSRRRKYNGGKGYIPIRWSRTLASAAKNYAENLGNNCKNGALVHAKGIQDGENLAKNQGSGTWAQQYSADKIMGRWVENELNWPYPKNAHMTQVVWRATQYVGCGESVRNIGNNKQCRVQVCRYTRAGNCNVRNGNWRAEAWKDDTGCGRACPGEGCFV